ncbi:MAG: hypothetical protein R3301_19960, partial [Saprospiraceae bacterium]|nr:hypothetical protein [Saprospiraceae bacterium]
MQLLIPVRWGVLLLSLVMVVGQKLTAQKQNSPYSYVQMVEALAHTGPHGPEHQVPKQQKRAMHFLQTHLNPEGKVFNHIAMNMQELQQLYLDTLGGNLLGEWHPMGPYTIEEDEADGEGTGRVNCLAFATASRWYAGTAGGGLWKTEQSGIYIPGQPYPWEPLTDNLPILGVSGIVVNPGIPDELYILTGDGDGMTPFVSGSSQNYAAGDVPSIGVLKSADGGLTWDSTSLTFTGDSLVRAYKLITYPGSVDTMFAATSEGLFRTDDGWMTPPDLVINSTVFDVEFHPTDPQIIYAAGTSVLRRSTDGGVNFSNAGVGSFADVNPSQSCRMAIAVTPALPDALYVIMAKLDTRGMLSLQFSADQAGSFIEFTDESYNVLCRDDPEDDPSGQGNYDLAIWADPDVSSRFIVGGIDLWLNAFGSWSKLVDDNDSPPTYTHADIHAIETNPFTGNLVVGTDGGVFHSDDGGYNWTNRGKGLSITQFYHFDIHTDYIGFPTLGAG